MVQVQVRSQPWYSFRNPTGSFRKLYVAALTLLLLLVLRLSLDHTASIGLNKELLDLYYVPKEDVYLEEDSSMEEDSLLQQESSQQQQQQQQQQPIHKVAGLSCAKYGGPSDEIASEMIYWSDIPSDAAFSSPYQNVGPKEKYLTFEPDEGGWNNVRMALETAVAMAFAMGRTLVMPPEYRIYLLGKDDGGQKNSFTFEDFFHFGSVELEHAGFNMISFDEFLQRQAMTGQLRDKRTGRPSFPPGNRTDFSGQIRHRMGPLYHWLRSVTNNPIWFFERCVVALYGPGEDGIRRARTNHQWALSDGRMPPERIASYDGNPTPVDADAALRLREMMGTRRDLCVYDRQKQQAKVLHLMGDNKSGARLLVHFYAFLHFENWRQDLWMKRFVRDHLRYMDEIQCAAARVVHAIRETARRNGDPNGIFDSFHIRRGDFQYKDTRVEAPVIFENSRDVLVPNSTIYIATDERNRTFFEGFRQHYNIYFLDDFRHLLQGVNTNYYGMLDQLIASRGRTFVGTFYSTFSGYINRLRGYHSQKDKADGYEEGLINSYYYIPMKRKFDLRSYRSIQQPMWGREFPVAWRSIDKGIGELR